MSLAEAITQKGLVDTNLYDYVHTRLEPVQDESDKLTGEEAPPLKAPDGTEIPCRYMKFRVPNFMNDQAVAAAWQFGNKAVNNATSGIVTILFPHVQYDKQGTPNVSIANFEMVSSGPEDINRLLQLAKVLSDINIATVKAAQNPINAVSAMAQAKKAKDNATSNAVAKAQGFAGGIVTA